MILKTGLVPRVERHEIHPKLHSPAHLVLDEATVLLPPLPATAPTWLIALRTPSDTPERRKGTVMSAFLVTSQPKFVEEYFTMILYDDTTERNQDLEARHRRQYGAPDDAEVIDAPAVTPGAILRTIRWNEVTV